MEHEHEHTHTHSHGGVEHNHTHSHAHSHDHGEAHDHAHGAAAGAEDIAVLRYMLDHNVHHCAELQDLGNTLTGEAAHQVAHAVEAFDQANGYLASAIEELKKK